MITTGHSLVLMPHNRHHASLVGTFRYPQFMDFSDGLPKWVIKWATWIDFQMDYLSGLPDLPTVQILDYCTETFDRRIMTQTTVD